ncbi:MAG: ATP-dependent helicase Lhr and Lhr-like helicase [Actinomycetota bacterium]|jgi:ATP-dependent Lhr-like helicase|nr:ATP-dependent helicase Lhr and Lhr-like helicase [Actinomycetota bacterium]
MPETSSLERFSGVTRAWFETSFQAPTTAQAGAWEAISSGENALVIAPTGSGKTLAAFLWAIDSLVAVPIPEEKKRLRTLYISPLKALAVDVERNLRSPLNGIRAAGQRLAQPVPDLTVGMRTGDTPQEERRRFATHPPDILITTPESLFLLLTSQAREALRYIDTVIVDEVHAVAGTKRGSHLALSLERLDELLDKPAQRIGLSATVRPPDEIARFLGGIHPVRIINPPSEKRFDLSVVVPVEDMSSLGELTGEVAGSASGVEQRTSVWPHVEERLLELIRAHKSTIVFANSRRLSERLCARLNEMAEEEIVRAHHGSVSREQRLSIEEDLKAGRLPAVVATSSLELGIDMGAVDLVVQVEAPDSVASGLQRIGRAGHQVGAVSRGVIFPKFRGDLLECAVVTERMLAGQIEEIHYPRNPLDVLAQQIVAMTAMDPWTVDDLERVVQRAAPFADMPRNGLESVLDMLSGRYPSDEFAELRPRLNWDRVEDTLTGRPNAQRLAVTSAGTIPDRGLFGVFLAGEKGPRVGELDEEMVYESRPGETFLLGASTWLIEDITHDRVIVTPAPGQPGKMPFWHGDALGRPIELGRALGAFIREVMAASPPEKKARLEASGLDPLAVDNLLAYLEEQRQATGTLPDDRTIVVERFRDELGDWRVCIHSPFGARVHAPWAQAIEARVRQRLGLEIQCIYTDDGIVIRIPEADEAPLGEAVFIDPEEIDDLVIQEVGQSALFASRFRECSARALLLPKRNPGKRQPLWQQRQKSAHLLQVASRHESFPIMLETYRECLQDVFDLPALKELMSALQRREIRVVEVDTPSPSPFASSLQFGFVSAFMYEGDAPLAERRAQALSLDRSLLAEIMGHEELRELIDDHALGEIELELQMLSDNRKIKDKDGLHDAFRSLGDLTVAEVKPRCLSPHQVQGWLEELEADRRTIKLMIAGAERWAAIEDASRFRDALGTPLPVGIPDAFLETVADPLSDLVARFARTHGPFVASDVAARLGLGVAIVEGALGRLEVAGRVAEGEFRPGGHGSEWIDVEVLRRLRRRSLAAFRRDVEPVAPEVLARFDIAWQGIASGGGVRRESTLDDVFRVVEQLAGAPIPASALERQVLAARLPGYSSALLDQLGASGEVVWAGSGPIGQDDGWVVLATADKAHLLLPEQSVEELSPTAIKISDVLSSGGAMFFRQIADATGSTDDQELLLSLWELVWAGVATNDTLAPLRALVGGGRPRSSRSNRGRRGPAFPSRLGPPAAAGRWSLVPIRTTDATRRLHATAEQLLVRHGIVTRGAVMAEHVYGGFAAVYPVLKAMEDSGRCRRGYFVEGLGGAQFAMPGAVDRMRALAEPLGDTPQTYVLAATDPANPYGSTLPWPQREGTHRPGRKAGAVVVLVDGELELYVEKGGKTLLSYSDEAERLQPAADALALAAREGLLGKLSVEKADGGAIQDSALARALVEVGFKPTARGLRLRA